MPPTCFMMQPFDRDKFDKRYKDVFSPAVEAAGLTPYRVDNDLNVNIPIEDIERGIKGSRVCFAEITTDNPNVWFELGYAIALGKPVCLVCSKERKSSYPFDVRHRLVLEYSVGSPSDFKDLEEKITARLKAIVEQEATTEHLATLQPTSITGGLAPHEVSALAIIGGCLGNDGISSHFLLQGMERAGFTDTAAGIAIISLKRKGMVTESYGYGPDVDETWNVFFATEIGHNWLIENQDSLDLRRPADPPSELPF